MKQYFTNAESKENSESKESKAPIPLQLETVDFKLENIGDEEVGVITKIHERKNFIVRKSVNLSKQTHVIASNIDQVFLLVTVKNPPTLTTFIDRFLVTAEAYSIQTVLLFNKIDTYNAEEYAQVQALKKIYETIGYQCIEVSSTKGTHLNQIKELMKAKVSMFSVILGWVKQP